MMAGRGDPTCKAKAMLGVRKADINTLGSSEVSWLRGSQLPGLKSQPHLALQVESWAKHFIALGISFSRCKMGTPHRGKHED